MFDNNVVKWVFVHVNAMCTLCSLWGCIAQGWISTATYRNWPSKIWEQNLKRKEHCNLKFYSGPVLRQKRLHIVKRKSTFIFASKQSSSWGVQMAYYLSSEFFQLRHLHLPFIILQITSHWDMIAGRIM